MNNDYLTVRYTVEVDRILLKLCIFIPFMKIWVKKHTNWLWELVDRCKRL